MTSPFGAQLQLLRKKYGLTQAQLAEKLEFSTNYISQLENGVSAPSYKFLALLLESYPWDANLFFSPAVSPSTQMSSRQTLPLSPEKQDALFMAASIIMEALNSQAICDDNISTSKGGCA